jgi:hypothetical protein
MMFKTKRIVLHENPERHTVLLPHVHTLFTRALPQHSEPGWAICGLVAAPFYTKEIKVTVIYRKTG